MSSTDPGQLRETKKAGLLCLESNVDAASTCIVVLHGYGASERDFAPVASMMNLPSSVRWVFPRGIQTIDLGLGTTGFAWFPIDTEALNRAMAQGTHRRFDGKKLDGFEEAKKSVLSLIDELPESGEQIILCGFSQGAMLATEVALEMKTGPKALCLLSSSYIHEIQWRERAANKKSLPVIQTHGRSDPLLSYTEAELLYRDFLAAGMKIQFHGFDGGHEVPTTILSVWAEFLTKHTRSS